jgi:hypothetical protein
MTSPGNASSQPLLWLEARARALEIGHWRWIRATRSSAVPLDGSREQARLAVLQQVMAEVQRALARGDVGAALERIGQAVRLLSTQMTVTHSDTVRAVLAPEPSAPGLARCTWRTACVVWREQEELRHLLAGFVSDRLAAQEVLVVAYGEIIRWVLEDPWWPGPANGDGVDIGRFDTVLRSRATRLWRLTVPGAGDISPGILRGMGGSRAVYGQALSAIATSPLEPWSGRSAAADRVPVRCGRLRTRQRAVQWLADQEMLAIP